MFGLFLSGVFARHFSLPAGFDAAQAAQAARSIGDAFVLAQTLDSASAGVVANATRQAFTVAHSALLATAAVVLGTLAIVVYILLGLHAASTACSP